MVPSPASAPAVPRPLSPIRVIIASFAIVGVDLFFNAGVFSALFDQSREPSLLPDPVLFRRIPFAYVMLAIGVVALGWLLETVDAHGRRAALVGALAGILVGMLGLGLLWTALDMTGIFVVSGVAVIAVEGATAAVVLTSARGNRSLAARVAVAFVLLVVAGQVVANLVGRP